MNGKFRAWDNKYNKYFEPIYNACYGELEEIIIHMNGRLALRTMEGTIDQSMFPDRFIIEHYTGLNDKNGKEIYEGDICKLIFNTVVVEFTSGSFKFRKITDKDVFFPVCDFTVNQCYPEVLGNIHENPELVEVKKNE